MVDIVKRGGRAPLHSPIWAYFSIMMEYTPKSGYCHSVRTLCTRYFPSASNEQCMYQSADATLFINVWQFGLNKAGEEGGGEEGGPVFLQKGPRGL